MTRFKEIHDYLVSIDFATEEELRNLYDFIPYKLAEEIAVYAHRNQKRENGENYVNHPMRTSKIACDLISPNEEEFEGVEVLAILHDVIEDSDFTIDDIEDIFKENKLGDFFKEFIKEELIALTHNKNEDYEVYIKRIMQYPAASLVKLSDLCDNLNLLTLNAFDTKEYERCSRYLKYAYYINSKYHFIEASHIAKEEARRKELENKLKEEY